MVFGTNITLYAVAEVANMGDFLRGGGFVGSK